NYYTNPESFNLRDTLRPAVFVPESKRLNVLLRDFRANRNHIAIVVDEYGGVSGLVTIEDVLEQIVGDIEDEYDFDEAEDNIIPEGGGRYRVKAQTEIGDFNSTLGGSFSDEEFHTIGGLVVQAFGAGLFGTGASWVYVALARFGGMEGVLALLATAFFCAYYSFFLAASGWLVARLTRKGSVERLAAAAACWTLAEWLRSLFFSGF